MPPIARFGIIGDIHAEEVHLQLALAHFQRAGVDAILSVGDIADGDGDLDSCYRLLRSQGVLAVRGNHDRGFAADEMRSLRRAHFRSEHRLRARLSHGDQRGVLEAETLQL